MERLGSEIAETAALAAVVVVAVVVVVVVVVVAIRIATEPAYVSQGLLIFHSGACLNHFSASINQTASMQSACHALSTQCHGEEYAYLAMSGTMDTCKHHAMSCQAGPAKRSISAHTHTLKLAFSIEAQVCIYWSCSTLLLHTVHLKQQLITSLKLITTLCARTECSALHMRSCYRRTAPHALTFIHTTHMSYINQVTQS